MKYDLVLKIEKNPSKSHEISLKRIRVKIRIFLVHLDHGIGDSDDLNVTVQRQIKGEPWKVLKIETAVKHNTALLYWRAKELSL